MHSSRSKLAIYKWEVPGKENDADPYHSLRMKLGMEPKGGSLYAILAFTRLDKIITEMLLINQHLLGLEMVSLQDPITNDLKGTDNLLHYCLQTAIVEAEKAIGLTKSCKGSVISTEELKKSLRSFLALDFIRNRIQEIRDTTECEELQQLTETLLQTYRGD